MNRKHITLARRVANRRQSRGLSIGQAAGLIGCSKSTLFRVEAGEQTPTPELLESIARAFDLGLSELYALAGYPVTKELPDVGEYVRLKHHDFPPRAHDELEAFLLALQAGS